MDDFKTLNHSLTALPSFNPLAYTDERVRLHGNDDFDCKIFNAFEAKEKAAYQFDGLLLANMLTGRKVIYPKAATSFDFRPGQTFILSPNSKIHIDYPEANQNEPTQCTVLVINPDKINAVLDYLNAYSPKSLTKTKWDFKLEYNHFVNSPETIFLLTKFYALLTEDHPHKDALANLYLKELLIKTLHTQELLLLQGEKGSNANPLGFLKNYIQTHLAEPLNVALLSQKANLSPSTLFRRFKAELGISPMEFVIRQRIEHAKKLLSKGRDVKETAFESGFSDANYFIRAFKQREGLTPGAYTTLNG